MVSYLCRICIQFKVQWKFTMVFFFYMFRTYDYSLSRNFYLDIFLCYFWHFSSYNICDILFIKRCINYRFSYITFHYCFFTRFYVSKFTDVRFAVWTDNNLISIIIWNISLYRRLTSSYCCEDLILHMFCCRKFSIKIFKDLFKIPDSFTIFISLHYVSIIKLNTFTLQLAYNITLHNKNITNCPKILFG